MSNTILTVHSCVVQLNDFSNNFTVKCVSVPPGDNIIQQSPPGSVAAGTQKSLTCTTDSANPAPEITWLRWDGQPVTGKVETSNPNGQYNAKKTISTITIVTTKDHNRNDYACVMKYRNNEIGNLKRTAKLDVSCMLYLIFRLYISFNDNIYETLWISDPFLTFRFNMCRLFVIENNLVLIHSENRFDTFKINCSSTKLFSYHPNT